MWHARCRAAHGDESAHGSQLARHMRELSHILADGLGSLPAAAGQVPAAARQLQSLVSRLCAASERGSNLDGKRADKVRAQLMTSKMNYFHLLATNSRLSALALLSCRQLQCVGCRCVNVAGGHLLVLHILLSRVTLGMADICSGLCLRRD